jgi:hypothetical protein
VINSPNPTTLVLALRRELIRPAVEAEPLAGLPDRGVRHAHRPAQDVRAGQDLVDGLVVRLADRADDEVHAGLPRVTVAR